MGSGVVGSAQQRVVDVEGDLSEDSSFDESLKELAFTEVLREVEPWKN